jgi:hypothetical protein
LDIRFRKAAEVVFSFLHREAREHPRRHYPCAFVMGSDELGPIEHAARLYKVGLVSHICFVAKEGAQSGAQKWGMPEAKKYAEELRKRRIPKKAIVGRDLSVNSLVEVLMAMPFIAELLRERGQPKPRRILVITRPRQVARALGGWRKWYPDLVIAGSSPISKMRELELSDPMGLAGEIRRLITYSASGDINVPPIPREVMEATMLIERILR